jgi:hypothetical protein
MAKIALNFGCYQRLLNSFQFNMDPVRPTFWASNLCPLPVQRRYEHLCPLITAVPAYVGHVRVPQDPVLVHIHRLIKVLLKIPYKREQNEQNHIHIKINQRQPNWIWSSIK